MKMRYNGLKILSVIFVFIFILLPINSMNVAAKDPIRVNVMAFIGVSELLWYDEAGAPAFLPEFFEHSEIYDRDLYYDTSANNSIQWHGYYYARTYPCVNCKSNLDFCAGEIRTILIERYYNGTFDVAVKLNYSIGSLDFDGPGFESEGPQFIATTWGPGSLKTLYGYSDGVYNRPHAWCNGESQYFPCNYFWDANGASTKGIWEYHVTVWDETNVSATDRVTIYKNIPPPVVRGKLHVDEVYNANGISYSDNESYYVITDDADTSFLLSNYRSSLQDEKTFWEKWHYWLWLIPVVMIVIMIAVTIYTRRRV